MNEPSNAALLEKREKNVPKGVYHTTPLFVAKAKGAVLEDVEGKRYIDFTGGIGVENIGHCAEEVVSAIKDQADKYIHTSFHTLMYEPYVELAYKLNSITPGSFAKKTMFGNSGAEAIENAVKIARYYARRSGMIAFEGGYHGRTFLTMSLTGRVRPFKAGFGPFAADVYRLPFAYCYRCSYGLTYPSCDLRCAYALKDFFQTHVAPETVSCIVFEPVLGEGGFVVPPKDFFKVVKQICSEYGILLICDEIQTGFGRTGKMFAIEHFGVEPDIIATSKSLAAGLPLSGITGKAEIMDSVHDGGLGGTYSGNPIACRAGLAVLSIFEKQDILGRANHIGKKVMTKFKELQEKNSIIGDVRGIGGMVGMELVLDRKTKEPAPQKAKLFTQKCYEKGLITILAGIYSNVIRTLMPFVITDEQLEQGLKIIGEVIGEINER
ncbi:MAG: 4-aminobutyrate transaminase [Deltaproteobacteria bacterium RBG_16_47_11]|nr:MAG: 4-aminobutyrate transaminase [Deltaproteobacteria bacterium RBG_16_47_11]